MRTFALVPVLALAVVASGLGLGGQQRHAPASPAAAAWQVPSFSLPPLVDGVAGLASGDLAGPRVKLVNVFGSWCGGCRFEHDLLMQLASDRRVEIVGINLKDDPARGAEWIGRYGNPYRLIGFDASGSTAESLGVSSAPETLVVDHRGRVRYRHAGPITPDVWKASIEPVIAAIESES